MTKTRVSSDIRVFFVAVPADYSLGSALNPNPMISLLSTTFTKAFGSK